MHDVMHSRLFKVAMSPVREYRAIPLWPFVPWVSPRHACLFRQGHQKSEPLPEGLLLVMSGLIRVLERLTQLSHSRHGSIP